MRWPLLVCVACGTPSDPPSSSAPPAPATPTKSMRTYPTGESVCEAFPVADINAIPKLADDRALPGARQTRPRCTYNKEGAPDVPSFVIQIQLTPSLDPVKRTFKEGRTI